MSELIFHSDLVQGSPAWKEHRAKFLNASDAPAMLGAAPNRTRLQLLTQFQTGVGVEHSDYVEERVFAPGHEAEALCRPLAEEVMGTELAPQVATRGRLGASLDGVTMLGDEWWEHKLLNAELRACMVPGATGRDLPLCYRIQLEQEAMVLGAERGLFSASEWTPDGKLLEHRHVWYESDPELAARIAAGWDQFLVDVANHVPVVEPVKPAPAAIKALPALLVQVRGEVVSSNLEPYRLAAEEFLAGIKTELATDQDFEDAAAAVKFCQAAEDRLARLMEEVFAQASSIDEARRSVEDISAMFRSKRLTLDKLVDTRKKSLRADIITEHQGLLDAHVKALNEANRRGWITRQTADFGEAIKGKRTLTSMREAAGVLLMQRKLALGELQNRMLENWAALTDAEGTDWAFLFADFATLGQKPKEDFQALASARVQAHKDAEAEKKRKEEERQRLEAERVAAAEQARQADAAALAATAPPAPSPAPAAQPEPPPAPPPVELSASMRAPAQLPPAAPAGPTEPLDLEREIAQGREVIQAMEDVADFALIGSAAYLPAEMVQDVDFAVLLDGKRRHAGEYTSAMATNDDWRLCGEYDTDKGLWFAVRKNNLNLMVTHDRGFFERYRTAIEVCKHLKIQSKADRIAVCQIVRDGKTADELIQF